MQHSGSLLSVTTRQLAVIFGCLASNKQPAARVAYAPQPRPRISNFIFCWPRGVLVAARSAARRCCSIDSISSSDASLGRSDSGGAQCSWRWEAVTSEV